MLWLYCSALFGQCILPHKGVHIPLNIVNLLVLVLRTWYQYQSSSCILWHHILLIDSSKVQISRLPPFRIPTFWGSKNSKCQCISAFISTGTPEFSVPSFEALVFSPQCKMWIGRAGTIYYIHVRICLIDHPRTIRIYSTTATSYVLTFDSIQ